jgi:integrase/recombinase XerD
MTTLRQRMIEDMRVRNLSLNTQKIYVDRVAKFAQHFGKSPELLGPEEIRTYQVYLIYDRNASWSTRTQHVSALRFLYNVTLGKEWMIRHIPGPRKNITLPAVLSPDEVSRFFEKEYFYDLTPCFHVFKFSINPETFWSAFHPL